MGHPAVCAEREKQPQVPFGVAQGRLSTSLTGGPLIAIRLRWMGHSCRTAPAEHPPTHRDQAAMNGAQSPRGSRRAPAHSSR